MRSPAGETREAGGLLTVVELNDQHAYARIEPGLTIDVGDRVRCGMSHPCTAFDKWRHIPVLDEDDRVDRRGRHLLLASGHPIGRASRTMLRHVRPPQSHCRACIVRDRGRAVSAASARTAAPLTLTASSKNVAFHESVTFVATVDPPVAGQQVSILDAAGVELASGTTGPDGRFSTDVRPEANLVAHASSLGVDSTSVSVGVRPS